MDSRPNFLIVMPDQMRGDCLSIENHPVLQTPHIDGIGRAGVHFTRGYTTCASCIAARRSLLTGQFPATNGVVGYRERIPIATPTVTELLRDAGYATAIVGRYMHQSPAEEPYGFEKRVLGSTYVKDDNYARYLDEHAPELGGIRGIGLSCNGREAKPWPVDDELHPTNWAIRETRKILSESDSDRPIFLVASFYSPHPPLFPPAGYMDDFLGGDLPPVAIGDWETPPPRESFENNVDASRVDLHGEELRRAQAGYFGMIKQIDDLLPALLEDYTRRSEKDRRSWLIVFISDHGEMLGDHYLFRKCEPYEGSSRIPFLMQGSPELGLRYARGPRAREGCRWPGDEMPKIMRHPVTTAAEYVVAAVFTFLYIGASTAPKYEEVFGLMIFTFLLAIGALFVSVTNPRPIANTTVFTVLCFAGWTGCTWMLHREYGYNMTDIPALWIGALISSIACVLLLCVNKFSNWCRKEQRTGQQPNPCD